MDSWGTPEWLMNVFEDFYYRYVIKSRYFYKMVCKNN